METTTQQIERKARISADEATRICIRTGLVVFALLVGYFLVMKLAGFAEIISLRAFNFLFLAGGIWYTIRRFAGKSGRLGYFRGLKTGLYISLFAVVPFAAFIFIYLNIDKDFMYYLNEHAFLGEYLNPLAAAGIIFIEGLVSGMVFTFVIMPYYKMNVDENIPQTRETE